MRAFPVVVLVLALIVILSAAWSNAEQSTRLLWQKQGSENVVSAAWIEDLDGDQVPDILFEAYDAGAPATDHLFAISGASEGIGTVIWSARPLGGPSNSGGYGEHCLNTSNDLTGDGVSDVLYGAAWGNRSAFVLDGMTGNTFWSFDTYEDTPPSPAESGWVYEVSSLGRDINFDGVHEVIFCAGSENHCVYCADGATGEIIWHYRGWDAFMRVTSIADVDGDHVRDVMALQSDNYPKVFVFNGRGAGGGAADIIWSEDMPSSILTSCELVESGEETPTLVIGCWNNYIYGYDAETGAFRWQGNVGSPVMRVVVVEDVDSDGIDDIGVGSWGSAGRIHSGADGSTIWATPVGNDCWTVDPVDDTNGDGHQELVVGSFNGRVYLMDGVTGDILWNYYVSDKLFTVRGVPDLTGNGIPDVIAGTQRLNSSGGVCYALEGNDDVVESVDDLSFSTDGVSVYPNPSRGVTTWSITLSSHASDLSLELYDPSGRLVRVVHHGIESSGHRFVTWDGRCTAGGRLPSGTYLGRLTGDGALLGTERVLLLR